MKFSLDGECNRCGICCVERETGARCENLEINGAVGAPMTTRCKVYGERYNGMPVRMIDPARRSCRLHEVLQRQCGRSGDDHQGRNRARVQSGG